MEVVEETIVEDGGAFGGGFLGDPYGGGFGGTTVVDYGPGYGGAFGVPVGVPNCCCSLIWYIYKTSVSNSIWLYAFLHIEFIVFIFIRYDCFAIFTGNKYHMSQSPILK